MKVTNLVAWAGEDFAFAAGDVVDLPPATAKARVAAGLAEAINGKSKDTEEVKETE